MSYLVDCHTYKTLEKIFQCQELEIIKLFDFWRDKFEDVEALNIKQISDISRFLIVEMTLENNNIPESIESNRCYLKQQAFEYIEKGREINSWIASARVHPHYIVKALTWWQSQMSADRSTIYLFIRELISQVAIQAALEIPGNVRILSELDSTSYLEGYIDTPLDISELVTAQQIHAAAWRTGEIINVGRWTIQRDDNGEFLQIIGAKTYDANGLLFELGCEFKILAEGGYICTIPHHMAIEVIGKIMTI